MSGTIVIKNKDGEYRTEPSNASVIQADGGVYVSYDIDSSEHEFRFIEGAEVMGTYYGDLELIGDPSDGDSWLTEVRRQFS